LDTAKLVSITPNVEWMKTHAYPFQEVVASGIVGCGKWDEGNVGECGRGGKEAKRAFYKMMIDAIVRRRN